MRTDDSEAVRAVVAELRRLCDALPGAEQYVMVHHPAFRVGKKPFVIAGMLHGSQTTSVSINLGPEMQHQLLGDARFAKTPYLGRHGWVTIARGALEQGELAMLVTESWRRIANNTQLAALARRSPDGPATKSSQQTSTRPAKKVVTKPAKMRKTSRTAGGKGSRSP